MINFSQDHHKRHPMAHLSGRCMRRPLWVENLINVFRHYRIRTTDWSHKDAMYRPYGRAMGWPLWGQFWLMYYITTGSSQQTPHGSSIKAMHGVSLVSSELQTVDTGFRIPGADLNTGSGWGVIILYILIPLPTKSALEYGVYIIACRPMIWDSRPA